MLKFVIEKLEDVEEALRGLYQKGDDGKFYLSMDIKDHPEFQKVLENKNQILDEKKQLQKKMTEQEKKDHDDQVKNHEKEQEYEQALALEREKHKKEIAAMEAERNSYKDQVKTLLVDNQVEKIAADLSETPNLVKPHIAARMEAVEKDGKLVLSIKDMNGNASAMTADQLADEFRNNKEFAGVIKGRDSGGSGAEGDKGGKGGSGNEEFSKYFDPKHAEYSLTKQIEIQKTNPDVYKDMSTKFDPLAAVMVDKSAQM